MNEIPLSTRDQQVIWHPYTQHQQADLRFLLSGRRLHYYLMKPVTAYIDAISSWWVNIHGHAHPYIAEKIYQQAMRWNT